MRIIFLGTPEFAVPSLEKLVSWNPGCIVAVVTQPDRPAGRGQNVFAPPTRLVANRFGIPVLQPEKLSKSPDIVAQMKELKPDVLVTCAFGQILKRDVLEMAPHGVINVHGSILPAYRGAAPINWAIINGETKTGITTMFSDVGVDTGDMILKREVPVGPDTNAEELAETLSFVGADLLVETLDQLASGKLVRIPQNNEEATAAPRLTRELGVIDWTISASKLHNLVRGLYSWPGTEALFNGAPVKIIRTALAEPAEMSSPGTIISIGDKMLVACGADGMDRLAVLDVKPQNKGRMSARDWANGARIKAGVQFTLK